MIIFLDTSQNKTIFKVSLEDGESYDFAWESGRELSKGIFTFMEESIQAIKPNLSLNDINAIVYFKGPGSFTGLRIGATVVNTLAYSLNVPIVGVTTKDWMREGESRLKAGQDDKIVIPDYGRPAHITSPRK